MNVLKKHNKEFRFLIVGGCSTLIDFIIYMVLSCFINIVVAKMISMIIACLFSFFVNKQWTFSFKQKTNVFLVMKFIISQILNILINTTTNAVLFKLFGIKILAFVFATFIAMIFNFLFQNYVVFKGGKK